MVAHLINQQVLHEIIALQILSLFLENPTEDSIELASTFTLECGHVLTEQSPAGVSAIFERFRGILQDGKVTKRCQYTIEKLFKERKNKFKNHPGIVPELDLIEEDDKITHEISLDDEDLGNKSITEDSCNIFQFDPNYNETEKEWAQIRTEILGESKNLIEASKQN